MGLQESRAQLTRGMKDLQLRWEQTRTTWRDRRAAAFEKDVLDPLAAATKSAANAMDQLVGNLDQARRECGPQ